MKKLCMALIGAIFVLSCSAAREDFAVLYIRGLNSNESLSPMILAFQQDFPTIPVVVAKIGDGGPATTNRGMYHLLADVYADASTNPVLAGKRVIIVGSSQGGLLGRAFIEKYGDMLPFTIDSFISCAGPQAGEFGLPDGWESYVDLIIWHGDTFLLDQIASLLNIKTMNLTFDNRSSITVENAIEVLGNRSESRDILDPIRTALADLLKNFIRQDFPLVRIIFYNLIGQDLISVANYWKDPEHKAEYLVFNTFLPYFNNEKPHDNAERYKANLQKLRYMVLFWATIDNVIKPDRSGGLQFYKWGSRILLDKSFTETEQYKNNLLGLRFMYDNGHLFFENPQGMGHGCEGPAIPISLRYFHAIIDNISLDEHLPLNIIFDAVKANDFAQVQNIVSTDPTRVFERDGFNKLAIYYAGNKPEIAQYLFTKAIEYGKPLSIEEQNELLVNASGSGSIAVAQWLIESLHFNPTDMRATCIAVANNNNQSAVAAYLQQANTQTLHSAVAQNNLALVTSLVTANPTLIAQFENGMLPIYYAGNKLEIAQILFALHKTHAPIPPTQLYQLLYYAFGSGSLDVAKWIIEDLYFDPTIYKQSLISVATANYQTALVNYLNTFLAQGRTSIHMAVCNNNLALVQQIVSCNPSNIEQLDSSAMLPIYYAGNKLEIAQYLYTQHLSLGRPLSNDQLNILLGFAFGAGAQPVAQWLLETIGITPTSVSNLIAIAQANGQQHMITYLHSIGLA